MTKYCATRCARQNTGVHNVAILQMLHQNAINCLLWNTVAVSRQWGTGFGRRIDCGVWIDIHIKQAILGNRVGRLLLYLIWKSPHCQKLNFVNCLVQLQEVSSRCHKIRHYIKKTRLQTKSMCFVSVCTSTIVVWGFLAQLVLQIHR